MANSVVVGTPTVQGGHYVVTVQHPSGAVLNPRFRNVLPASGYADLPTYQAACQAAATALCDAATSASVGPNATRALLNLR